MTDAETRQHISDANHKRAADIAIARAAERIAERCHWLSWESCCDMAEADARDAKAVRATPSAYRWDGYNYVRRIAGDNSRRLHDWP